MKRLPVVMLAIALFAAGYLAAPGQSPPGEPKNEPVLADGAIVVRPPAQAGPGRYESELQYQAGHWFVTVTDTWTGRVWLRTWQIGKWQDLGTPVGSN